MDPWNRAYLNFGSHEELQNGSQAENFTYATGLPQASNGLSAYSSAYLPLGRFSSPYRDDGHNPVSGSSQCFADNRNFDGVQASFVEPYANQSNRLHTEYYGQLSDSNNTSSEKPIQFNNVLSLEREEERRYRNPIANSASSGNVHFNSGNFDPYLDSIQSNIHSQTRQDMHMEISEHHQSAYCKLLISKLTSLRLNCNV